MIFTRRLESLLFVLPVMISCKAASVLTGGSDSCSGPTSFVPGSTVTGITSQGTNNCKSPDGSVAQLFTMTLSQPENLELQLAANGFPPHLGLYTSNDDIISLTNEVPSRVKAFLPAGSYKIVVASTSGRDGTYSLTSTPAEQKGCTPGESVTVLGTTIAGAITVDDCAADGIQFDFYGLRQLPPGISVTISGTVGAPASILLLGPSSILAQKDMAAAGSFTMTTTVPAQTGYSGLRIESRRVNNIVNLPVSYTITLK